MYIMGNQRGGGVTPGYAWLNVGLHLEVDKNID